MSRKTLSSDQKTELVNQLLSLILEKYPESDYVDQEDVLLLAYHAATNTPHFRNLLAAG